jgi:hypothetical protein
MGGGGGDGGTGVWASANVCNAAETKARRHTEDGDILGDPRTIYARGRLKVTGGKVHPPEA